MFQRNHIDLGEKQSSSLDTLRRKRSLWLHNNNLKSVLLKRGAGFTIGNTIRFRIFSQYLPLTWSISLRLPRDRVFSARVNDLAPGSPLDDHRRRAGGGIRFQHRAQPKGKEIPTEIRTNRGGRKCTKDPQSEKHSLVLDGSGGWVGRDAAHRASTATAEPPRRQRGGRGLRERKQRG